MSGGGLRKVQPRGVWVPQGTIRDKRLSFRARGALAFMLDLPDGWDMRSAWLAEQSSGEGREAIRTVLHELGRAGYYRLERRRLRDGKMAMGTAVSATPVEEWARDYAESGGRAISVAEQTDGSFVKAKPKRAAPADPAEAARQIAEEGQEPDILTGDRFPGAGEPGPGVPDSGQPGSGPRGALSSRDTQDINVERLPATADAATAEAKTSGAITKADPNYDAAEAVARWWWDRIPNPVGSYVALRNNVGKLIAAGWTQRQTADALLATGTTVPGVQQLERAARGLTGSTPAAGPREATTDRKVREAQELKERLFPTRADAPGRREIPA